jgi:hypothetical protein
VAGGPECWGGGKLESISIAGEDEDVGSSPADKSGAVASCGSTTVMEPGNMVHRSSMRERLKSCRPLAGQKSANERCWYVTF